MTSSDEATCSGSKSVEKGQSHAKNRLVLFVHGISGDATPRTWARFKELLESDTDIAAKYDVMQFQYPSARIKGYQSVTVHEAAENLRVLIETDFREYGEIAIIAHSQGCLVTRRFIASQLKHNRVQPIGRILFFAGPHMGAILGKAAQLVPFATTKEARDLGYDSDILKDLLADEAAVGAQLTVAARFVVAENDAVVGITSAWGIGLPGDWVLAPGHDHTSVVKPTDTDHVSFKIVRAFLNDNAVRTAADASPIDDQPVLSSKQINLTHPDDLHRRRFVFWQRGIPFLGRDEELGALESFIAKDSEFCWLAVSGPGGVGKSRLALELVLAQRSGWWHAGFLNGLKTEEYWQRWQPRRPTLLIVDYAAQEPIAVGGMLRGLAEREGPFKLRFPVRVILLERDLGDHRLKDAIWKSGEARGKTFRHDDIALHEMDVDHIFEHVLRGREHHNGELLQTLDAIDSLRRPLFAHLLADAVLQGRDPRGWDRTSLLEDVVARDRDKYWEKAAFEIGLKTKADLASAERLLALASLTGGVPLSALSDNSKGLLPSWNPDAHPNLFRAMTGRQIGEMVPPLEPDIVGEFHFLHLLEQLSEAYLPSGGTLARELMERAWEINPFATLWSLSRCVADFPDHSTLWSVATEPPRGADAAHAWSILAVDLLYYLATTDAPLELSLKMYRDVVGLAESAEATGNSNASALRHEQARAAVNLSITSSVEEALRLYEVVSILAETSAARGQATSFEIGLRQAQLGNNLMRKYLTRGFDLEAAQGVYGDLVGLAERSAAARDGTTPDLRVQQVRAGSQLIVALGQDQGTIDRALELYESLFEWALALPESGSRPNEIEEVLLEFIIVTRKIASAACRRSETFDLADRFYGYLRKLHSVLATRYPVFVSPIRLEQSLVIGHLIAAEGVTALRQFELYDNLKDLRETVEVDCHRTTPVYWKRQAESAYNILTSLARNDIQPDESLRLYNDIVALAKAASGMKGPLAADLRVLQAKAACNLATAFAIRDDCRDTALRLYDDVVTLAVLSQSRNCPSLEPILFQQLGIAANLVQVFARGGAPIDRALQLYDELVVLADGAEARKFIDWSSCKQLQASAASGLLEALGKNRETHTAAVDLYWRLARLADNVELATTPAMPEIRHILVHAASNLIASLCPYVDGMDAASRLYVHIMAMNGAASSAGDLAVPEICLNQAYAAHQLAAAEARGDKTLANMEVFYSQIDKIACYAEAQDWSNAGAIRELQIDAALNLIFVLAQRPETLGAAIAFYHHARAIVTLPENAQYLGRMAMVIIPCLARSDLALACKVWEDIARLDEEDEVFGAMVLVAAVPLLAWSRAKDASEAKELEISIFSCMRSAPISPKILAQLLIAARHAFHEAELSGVLVDVTGHLRIVGSTLAASLYAANDGNEVGAILSSIPDSPLVRVARCLALLAKDEIPAARQLISDTFAGKASELAIFLEFFELSAHPSLNGF